MKLELFDQPVTEFPVLSDRRQDPRIEGSSNTVTLSTDDGHAYNGVVVNESFGGVGIIFDQRVPLQPDQEIELTYHGIATTAIVRHLAAFNRGGCTVGIHWKSSKIANQADELLQLLARPDLSIPSYLRRFIEMMPGGCQLLWRLNENAKWLELAENIQRLGRDAAAAGVQGTEECLVALLHLLEDTPDPAEVKQAIDQLISILIQRTADVAAAYQD